MNPPKQYGPPEPENQNVRLSRIEESVANVEPRVASIDARVANVESHVASIDARVANIDARVASIEEHGATKADLMALETRMIKWMIGTAVAVVGVIVAAGGVLLIVLPRLIPPR